MHGPLKSKALLAMATAAVAVLLGGCDAGPRADPSHPPLTPVVLQTDWFPQPEHGGFYQALAKGYYREAGLDVTILSGGPNAMSAQKVLKGAAHFAMNRADTIYTLACRDVPVVMVMATLQHDPQGLLLHASSPVDSLAQLDGRRVIAVPGLAWIRWLEAKHGIRMEIIPHDFGMERFLNDPSLIQQCLVTNEPFYARQAGVAVKVLRLSDSGFDPYHGIYCLADWAEAHPRTVAAFVEASVRGWRDFIIGDPAPALAEIAARNPKMTPAFMEYSYTALRGERLVTGMAGDGTLVGDLDPARLERLVEEMRALGLVGADEFPQRPWYTTRYLLRPADATAGGPP